MLKRLVVPLVAIVSLLAAFTPLSAQQTDLAQTAPAIGPWLGAPRGSITSVRALDGAITVSATAVDADSAQAIRYEIVVDGVVATSGATPRPTGVGNAVRFSDDVPASDGMHEVCLRLSAPRFDTRTVDCVQATTAPPETLSQATLDARTGVVISPTGVVVPVTGGSTNNWQVTTPCGAATTLTSGTFVDRARVVIDAGHGGSETGAYGGGLIEKDLNLEVAGMVVDRFNDMGISAEMTRTADYRLPIRTRADIATALAPDVFLSVHHNGGATRRATRPGTEVFYTTESTESQRLARIIYEDMVNALSQYDVAWVSTVNEGASVRLRDDGKDLYGIHRYSPDLNSIITEFIYLSNPAEARFIQQQGIKELQADLIVNSILRWWWTDDAGNDRGRRFTDSSSSGTGGFDACVDPALTGGAQLSSSLREDILVEHLAGPSAEPTISLLPALTLGR